MKLRSTAKFDDDFKHLPTKIKKTCRKQLAFLLKDLHHPSLRAKKIKGHRDIWEGRITDKYRFTFQIQENTYVLRRVGGHDDPLSKPY